MSTSQDRPVLIDTREFASAGHFTVMLATLGQHPKTAILQALEGGPLRFNQVVEALVDVSEGTVGTALRELDRDGFVRRHVDAGPPLRVLFRLTPLGARIAPSLRVLSQWAHGDREASSDERAQA